MSEPYCLAMVLCDSIHRDAATGKFTILGTFSTFFARQFPANASFVIYFAITDGTRETTARLRIIDSESGLSGSSQDSITEHEWAVAFSDPLMVMEIAYGVQVALPTPGIYHCELYAGNELLMSRRLLALDENAPIEGASK